MKILKEDVMGISDFYLEGNLDYTDKQIDDALIKNIDKCNYKVSSLVLADDEILLRTEVDSIINYLDAKTLEEIKLNISFEEDIPFSFNEEKSEELDIDFFNEELDLKELIFELILVNIPFNYSINKNDNVLPEEAFYEEVNQPFAKIFNEKE